MLLLDGYAMQLLLFLMEPGAPLSDSEMKVPVFFKVSMYAHASLCRQTIHTQLDVVIVALMLGHYNYPAAALGNPRISKASTPLGIS